MVTESSSRQPGVTGRVALVGLPDESATRLRAALERSGFEVAGLAPEDLLAEHLIGDFDVVIWTRALPRFMSEETFWRFLLSVQGFLICEDEDISETTATHTPISVHPRMSDEEIFARVNSRIFESGVRSRRRSPRISVGLPVTYSCGTATCQSTIRTLGRNGAYIVSLTLPESGTLLSVTFHLPSDPEPIQVEARVVYGVSYDIEGARISHEAKPECPLPTYPGFGVQFEGMTQTAQQRLNAFVERHLV